MESRTGWRLERPSGARSSRRQKNEVKRRLAVVLLRGRRPPTQATCPCRHCVRRMTDNVNRMLEAPSLYKPSSPQQPTVKRRRLRLSSVPLVDLRSTSLPGTSTECEEAQARLFSSTPTDFSPRFLPKSRICSASEGMEGSSSVRIKHLTNTWEGQSRFPKLDECAHFHYEFVELGLIQVSLHEEAQEKFRSLAVKDQEAGDHFPVQITSMGKTWIVRRTYENFCLLDEQLHRCCYDRKFSALQELGNSNVADLSHESKPQEALRLILAHYLERFSIIAGNLINCGPILNWLELDNRGNRLIVTDDSAINTPAVAAAYVVKRYMSQASDEISFEVGDMISVIDMPPPEESVWWRGKKGFEVGFFPCENVEVIGDKLPQSINIPKAPTKPVLRKHGKLISFFRSFILSRPSRRKLKQSGILKERVFGCDLGEHLLNSGHEIPMVLTCCSEFIEEHGIVDGIYRLSGVTSNIQKLRNSFDEDQVPNLNDSQIVQDIHCVASLLKMYFRELPNPLLTYQLYDKFVSAVQSDESIRLLNMRDVVQQLPPPHYRTLEYLIRHLACVASHGAETGMTPKNVAIVWAPNLLRSKELEIGSVAALQVVGVQAIVTEYLIRYVDLIFNEKLCTFPVNTYRTNQTLTFGTPPKIRPKSLAITTPTKLLSLEEARSRALSASAQSQQKYIEVGGGPATLPSKYHTVIELPDRKGSTKLKKSPSGWKSFFGKSSKSQSQPIREKLEDKMVQKIDARTSTPFHTCPLEKTLVKIESTFDTSKCLRSVKSAESLVSSCGISSHRNSDLSDIGGRKTSDILKSIPIDAMTTTMSSDMSSSHALAIGIRLSPHAHMRSMSHDSYFELTTDSQDLTTELTSSNSEAAPFHSVPQETTDDDSVEVDSSAVIDEDDDDVDDSRADDIPAVEEGGGDEAKASPKERDSKSPKKHRWKESDSTSPKSKLSLKEKLKQAFASPPSNRKAEDAAESVKPSATAILKDKLCHVLSPEVGSRRQLSGIDNLAVEDDENEAKDHSPNPKRKWSDIEKMVADGTASEVVVGGGSRERVVVERYGSEKTIIVEVHATQESEEDEEEDAVEVNGSDLKDEEGESPTSIMATISDNELLSVDTVGDSSDEMGEASLTEYTSDPDGLQPDSELSTPKSFIADILDSEVFSNFASGLENETIPVVFDVPVDAPGARTKETSDTTSQSQITEEVISPKQKFTDHTAFLSPGEKPQSETSTSSPATSGDGGPMTGQSDKEFAYSVLVDENCISGNEDDGPVEKFGSNGENAEGTSPEESSLELTSGNSSSCTLLPRLMVLDFESDCQLIGNSGVVSGQSFFPEERKEHSMDRVPVEQHYSPLDETKRRFESEIGRDILHERKMKLELEKIQSEQRTLSPPSDLKNRTSPIDLSPSAFTLNERKILSAKSLAANVDDPFGGHIEEVELRRSRMNGDSTEESKRNSEPIFPSREVTEADSKRHSEPQMSRSVCLGKGVNRKTSVKELLSMFEIPPSIESAESTMTPVSIQKSLTWTKTKTVTPTSPNATSLSSPESVEETITVCAAKPPQVPTPKTVDRLSPIKLVSNVGKTMDGVILRHSCVVEPSVPKEEKTCRWSNVEQSPVSSDAKVRLSSDSNELRRERIDKYKEERRAQLREKIRSESFRMNRDEKSEYVSRLKHKVVSPTSSTPSASGVGVSGESDSLNRKARAGDIVFPSHRDVLPRSPHRQTRSVSSESEAIGNPSSPKKGMIGESKMKSPTLKRGRGGSGVWQRQSSREDSPSIPTPTSLLRNVPGRRSLRVGSESDALDAGREQNERPFRRHGSLHGSDRARQDTIPRKEVPVKQRSLPLHDRGNSSSSTSTTSTTRFVPSPTRIPSRSTANEDRRVSVDPGASGGPKSSKGGGSARMEVKSFPDDALLKSPPADSGHKGHHLHQHHHHHPRRIREVAALFEKESGQMSVVAARARYLSQNSASTAEQGGGAGGGPDVGRRKANQYLSAV